MPTTIEELERVHLRFINVKDDARLNDVLSKILPNIVSVFLEPDLTNSDLENPKIKAIEQIIGHIMMRTKNSKVVCPPWASLIDIFNQEAYEECHNQNVKRHAAGRIYEFLFESFDRIPESVEQQLLHVLLLTQANDNLRYTDKCRLFLILIQRLSNYTKAGQFEKLTGMLQPILTEELKKVFLQMTLYYIVNNIAPESLQNSQRQTFAESIAQMTLKFKQEIKETQTQFVQSYEDTLLKVLGQQSLFKPEEVLPIMIVASLSNINKTKETAELTVRNIFQSLDLKDASLSEKVYRLLFSELYIYHDFSERQDQEIQQLPWQMQVRLIDYLIKFESSAVQQPLNQKLIYHCFFSSIAANLEKTGLAFVKHMIRFNDLITDKETVQFLRQTLVKIIASPSFGEETQSTALLHLGDMAMRNYEALNDDIELAISTFDRLKARIQILEDDGRGSQLRNDPIANNYLESLNRLRDCYEQKLTDTSKRNMIVGYVMSSLNKESGSTSNPEIIYLLFLYLIRLDTGNFNSSVLLHSIILKDHPDIKIKKEAQRQLEKFNQQMAEAAKSESHADKRILRPFLQDIQNFLVKNQMNFVYDASEVHMQEILTLSNISFKPDFIEKFLEISTFAIQFFKLEQKNKDSQMDLGDQWEVQDKVERLLIMNLNQNFQLVKADFSDPLKLIFDYLKSTEGQTVSLIGSIGLSFIFRLSQGSVNLAQRVLCLKILLKILSGSQTSEHASSFLISRVLPCIPSYDKPLDSYPHETRLSALVSLTLVTLNPAQVEGGASLSFSQMLGLWVEGITGKGQSGLSPNIIEQIKVVSACLRKLGQRLDLESEPWMNGKAKKVIDQLVLLVTRSEVEPNFRKYLIANMAGMVKATSNPFKLQLSEDLLTSMHEVDNADLQEPLGKTLAKIQYFAGQLTPFTIKMLGKVFAKQDEGVSLNVKRNSAIYVHAVVELYGKSQKEIQDLFLDIQRVFLKFLFDRKSYMQDLSSKSLSKIYHLGTPEVRTQLVDALSKTLSGEKSSADMQEKDDNPELLLEFKDNTSTEQRDKLKTYKDLCNIAVELGHRELIYQFLEVHRHLAHYQDIKNAAKGLSSIIMMDEKLRRDLLRIAPKILLMTYDHNNEVKETMRELWGSLIEVEKEEEIINSRWNEIFKEAFDGLNSKEYRRRQSSALALSDLLAQRSWSQLRPKFKEVFLTCLGLMDDQKDSVKLAAYQLSKTLKRISLKLGNIYTNGNVEELEEVLQIVIPMILDDCLRSTMQAVKFFAVDLLFDLVKTSQTQTIMKQLKLPNKYERQLVFNYNSEQKMKEIMNKFLDRITVEVLSNVSQMNKAVETINYFEQIAIEQGMSSGGKAKNKSGISEGELNDLRLKYTKESAWGEILKICRDQMTQDTFNKILNDLLNFMMKGHDQITKSAAIAFIDDIILENKLYLITPQNSKKIATKLIEIYSLNSVNAALSIKESIQGLYAQCLGLQMKILKEYPKTVAQLIEQLVKLPKELDIIVCLNIYEISKNFPEEMLKTQVIVQPAYPTIYVNQFQANDHRLKTLCKKAHTFLTDFIPNLVENSQEDILKLILTWLDSASYDDRVAASQAMQELTLKMTEEDMRGSAVVHQVVDKLHQLVGGKYFNNKESVVEGFMALIKVGGLVRQAEFVNQYVGDTCYKQVEKNLQGGKLAYKNQILRSMLQIIEGSKVIKGEVKQAHFEMLSADVRQCLQKVSEKAAMIESMDEFEEKREEEKQTLQSALLELDCFPYLLPVPSEDKGQMELLSEICKNYYQGTNWLVRNGILKCYLQIIKLGLCSEPTISFLDHLFQNVGDLGEKYDINLALISDIALLFVEGPLTMVQIGEDRFKANIQKIIKLLLEKGTEALIKNVDLIRKHIV